jgi:hypothetical protein
MTTFDDSCSLQLLKFNKPLYKLIPTSDTYPLYLFYMIYSRVASKLAYIYPNHVSHYYQNQACFWQARRPVEMQEESFRGYNSTTHDLKNLGCFDP